MNWINGLLLTTIIFLLTSCAPKRKNYCSDREFNDAMQEYLRWNDGRAYAKWVKARQEGKIK